MARIKTTEQARLIRWALASAEVDVLDYVMTVPKPAVAAAESMTVSLKSLRATNTREWKVDLWKRAYLRGIKRAQDTITKIVEDNK